jgi:sporulation protein YlmC with PRC-barrel domain
MRSRYLLTTALALALAGPGIAAAQQQGAQPQPQPQARPAQQQGGQQMQQAYSDFEGSVAELEQASEQQIGQIAGRIEQSLQGLEQGIQGAPNAREAQVEYQQAREAVTRLRQQPTAENRDVAVRELQELDRILVVMVEGEETTASASGGGTGARIQVEQARPQVQVEQARPQVQVEQRAPQVTVQQPQPQVQVTQPQPQVTVQQPRPQVTVQQPQPQVTVQQPRPEVTVQQARPEVTVQQAQPQVQVEQARPQVQVEQQGQPQVTVQRQGEPRVQVERETQAQAEQQGQAEREALIQREARTGAPTAVVVQPEREAAAAGPELPSGVQAQNLIGRDVVGPTGDQIGEVNDLLMDPQSGRIQEVIIAYGGFLGLGERLVAVPWSEVQFSTDGETIIAPMTEEQLETAEAWDDRGNPNLLRGR